MREEREEAKHTLSRSPLLALFLCGAIFFDVEPRAVVEAVSMSVACDILGARDRRESSHQPKRQDTRAAGSILARKKGAIVPTHNEIVDLGHLLTDQQLEG